MSVAIRIHPLKNNMSMLHLEVSHKGGKASLKSLKLSVYNHPKTEVEKTHNKHIWEKANAIKTIQLSQLQLGVGSYVASQQNFLKYFQSLVKERRKIEGSYGNWKSTYKHLEEFCNGKEVKLCDVNEVFLNKFKKFLLEGELTKSGTNLSQNSASSYFLKIRAALNEAYNQRFISDNPVKRVKGISLENLSKNVAFREKTFNVLYTEIGSNSSYLFQNLVSLGISASSSREISNYIIEKFGVVERKLRLDEEKRQMLQQKNDYQAAKKEFSSLLAKYQSGELIFNSSASGTSAFEYSNLLPESETQILVNTKRIKISFSKDSLIKFLPAHFNNDSIYLVVSNDGKLLSLESLNKEKIISIIDYPILNQWIKIDGQFFLTHKDKTFPVSYKCPAMVLETNNYVAENFFYFSIGNKEIEFISDKHIINSDFYNNIPGLEKKTFFIYEKDKIQSQILSLSGAKKLVKSRKFLM